MNLVTVKQAAEMLGISRQRVLQLIGKGRFSVLLQAGPGRMIWLGYEEVKALVDERAKDKETA